MEISVLRQLLKKNAEICRCKSMRMEEEEERLGLAPETAARNSRHRVDGIDRQIIRVFFGVERGRLLAAEKEGAAESDSEGPAGGSDEEPVDVADEGQTGDDVERGPGRRGGAPNYERATYPSGRGAADGKVDDPSIHP
ncbi:hypothetical protein DL767_002469 [Monosporascus sp. MG133]|nr:hypothetical protein DL767_002469 [Monosporascus sp. MG133]